MNLWEKYNTTFKKHAHKYAFCIANNYYTYAQFSEYIAGTRQLINDHVKEGSGIPIGVLYHDSIETFASIFAIWFKGHHFVPLHPHHPAAVNNEKIEQSGLQLIISSENYPLSLELKAEIISNRDLKNNYPLAITAASNRAYILFTSGSTGSPKGVPINIKNLEAFIDGFMDIYPDLSLDDHFLQTYDLTSDAAFTGYLIPLLIGATVYTLPAEGFKYLSIVKILQKYPITWIQFTPSILNYLRPYFKSMHFDLLKHSHFGGEALPYDLTCEWAQCVPNAEISNIYGPTETTITCTIFRSGIEQLNQKVYNGVLSIGKPLKEVKVLIVDENNRQVPEGEKGELLIGGRQVMEGYLHMPGEDKKYFLTVDNNGVNESYYRTGDLVLRDEEGDLFFCGRKDDQLKISGYRVEPAEVEMAVSSLTNGSKSRAYGYRNKGGTESMVVFIEQFDGKAEELKNQLRALLAPPLIPEKIISIPSFPINSSGKADKNVLFEIYSSQIYE